MCTLITLGWSNFRNICISFSAAGSAQSVYSPWRPTFIYRKEINTFLYVAFERTANFFDGHFGTCWKIPSFVYADKLNGYWMIFLMKFYCIHWVILNLRQSLLRPHNFRISWTPLNWTNREKLNKDFCRFYFFFHYCLFISMIKAEERQENCRLEPSQQIRKRKCIYSVLQRHLSVSLDMFFFLSLFLRSPIGSQATKSVK